MAGHKDDGKSSQRLEFISTIWEDVKKAHLGPLTEAGVARKALVLRYNKAIRNYVGALVRNEQDADDLAQQVVVRLLSGQFASADPEKGSFRRMLTVAAHNMVRSYWSRKRRHAPVSIDVEEVDSGIAEDPDQQGTEIWRQTLLAMAWEALRTYERTHPGSVAFTLLRLRVDYPDDDSDQLAVRLSEKTGRNFRPEATRQQLRRARVRFGQLVLEEVARTLDDPTPERVQEELIEAGLMPYLDDLLPSDWSTLNLGGGQS
jgi:RNA polymerase sigma factor (sigma-70 family)